MATTAPPPRPEEGNTVAARGGSHQRGPDERRRKIWEHVCGILDQGVAAARAKITPKRIVDFPLDTHPLCPWREGESRVWMTESSPLHPSPARAGISTSEATAWTLRDFAEKVCLTSIRATVVAMFRRTTPAAAGCWRWRWSWLWYFQDMAVWVVSDEAVSNKHQY